MKRKYVFPMILTVIFIVIISYLFINIKQPYITCDKTIVDDNNIKLKEHIVFTLEGNKINTMNMTKTIILPTDYNDKTTLKSIAFSLEQSYDYLKGYTKVTTEDNYVIVKVNLDKKGTILLNNIEFINDDTLTVKINSNVKSSNVIALSIGEQYSEGELMSRMKNNSYSCK